MEGPRLKRAAGGGDRYSIAVADTLSNVAPVTTKNGTCNQSFLITGRTPLYLTALYTDQINTAPSQLVKFVEALASTIVPLAVLFPTGPANLLKQDAGVANSMAQPYADLVGAISWQASQTDTEPLEQGSYLVKTPVGTVSISIEKLESLQSALKITEIADALESAWLTLGQGLATQLGTNPTACFATGRLLETNQNFSHPDAVDPLAHIINYDPSISSAQATACLGSYFGPEVANDPYFKKNSKLHLGPGYLDIQNYVPYQPMVFSEIASAMTGYATDKNANAIAALDAWFEPQVSVTDTGPRIFAASTTMSIEKILDNLKGAQPQFVSFGCAETDSTPDSSGTLDSGLILAIGKDGKPKDMLVVRSWWRYQGNSNQSRIYQIVVGANAAIQKELTDNKNNCGYHIKVNVPAAMVLSLPVGSLTAQPTPPEQTTVPVPAPN